MRPSCAVGPATATRAPPPPPQPPATRPPGRTAPAGPPSVRLRQCPHIVRSPLSTVRTRPAGAVAAAVSRLSTAVTDVTRAHASSRRRFLPLVDAPAPPAPPAPPPAAPID